MSAFSFLLPSPSTLSCSTPRSTPKCTLPSPDISARARTLAWARLVVCHLNLCPFAQQALDAGTTRTHVTHAHDEPSVQSALAHEISLITQSAPHVLSTTLLVLPHFAPNDFLRFHHLCNEMEAAIETDERLVDEVMLACFHPLHQWADTERVDDVINFDKRAPYPIINLLRAEQVDQYVNEGRTQGILERNQHTLQTLGVEKLKKMYNSLRNGG